MRPWSRAALARPPTSRYAVARGSTRDCRFHAPEQRLSLLSPGTGCRDSVVKAVARSRRAARRGGSVDQVERRLPRCPGGGRLISLSARLRPQRRRVAHGVLPGPRRGACRCKPETARPAARRRRCVGGPRPGRAWGSLVTPVTGCLTAVRRPGRDGPQPACRASPRARPGCAPATARRPVLRVPRPSLRARRGRPRRG